MRLLRRCHRGRVPSLEVDCPGGRLEAAQPVGCRLVGRRSQVDMAWVANLSLHPSSSTVCRTCRTGGPWEVGGQSAQAPTLPASARLQAGKREVMRPMKTEWRVLEWRQDVEHTVSIHLLSSLIGLPKRGDPADLSLASLAFPFCTCNALRGTFPPPAAAFGPTKSIVSSRPPPSHVPFPPSSPFHSSSLPPYVQQPLPPLLTSLSTTILRFRIQTKVNQTKTANRHHHLIATKHSSDKLPTLLSTLD